MLSDFHFFFFFFFLATAAVVVTGDCLPGIGKTCASALSETFVVSPGDVVPVPVGVFVRVAALREVMTDRSGSKPVMDMVVVVGCYCHGDFLRSKKGSYSRGNHREISQKKIAAKMEGEKNQFL